MSALDNYADNKKKFIAALEERSMQLHEAARDNNLSAARQLLQNGADATDELLSYLKSSLIDQILKIFHTDPSERSKAAAMELCEYFAAAGLECSPRANWQLNDHNWCVDGQISYQDGSDVVSVSAHYDSETGWGTGVC